MLIIPLSMILYPFSYYKGKQITFGTLIKYGLNHITKFIWEINFLIANKILIIIEKLADYEYTIDKTFYELSSRSKMLGNLDFI